MDTTPVTYQTGGSLPPGAPTYVVRPADAELLDAVLARGYCYVLNARQMGKSSLRVRTMSQLLNHGIICAEIELSGICSQQITVQQWYGGIIQELVSGFGIPINRRQWLQDHKALSPVKRLEAFIDQVLLKAIHQDLVVFIDEIDSVLGLSFPTEDFFALIRSCYDKRATHPDYRRLSFVLLGVATPSALMPNAQLTPFSIGRAIELQGFTAHNSQPLAQGLVGLVRDPTTTLNAVLDWTGGQPFLTQKLCWLLTQRQDELTETGGTAATVPPLEPVNARLASLSAKDWVAQVVHTKILTHWTAQDEPEHLRTIRDRILRNAQHPEDLLLLYRDIMEQGNIIATHEPPHLELCLSGLVMEQQGYLVVKNPIYAAIFDHQWITDALTDLNASAPSRCPINQSSDRHNSLETNFIERK